MKTAEPIVGGGALIESSPGENVTNDETRVITEGMMGVGDNHPQGDLYFVRLAGLPRSAKPREQRQLADGETQGSRHVCEVGHVFDADRAEVAEMIADAMHAKMGSAATRAGAKQAMATIGTQYIGPVIQTEGGRALVSHPEHGDHDYRGDMTIACVFQRSLDADEREARVRD